MVFLLMQDLKWEQFCLIDYNLNAVTHKNPNKIAASARTGC